jgi:signal transduction histidine kinase
MWRKLSQWIPFATDPPEEKDDEIIDSERINQVLYQRNFELAIKNKTLSLLSQLYEISNLTLSSDDLARKFVATIRTNLTFDLVGIFLFDKDQRKITPVAISASDAFAQQFKLIEDAYSKISISRQSKKSLFVKVLTTHKPVSANSLKELFSGSLADEITVQLPEPTGPQSAIVYPLESEGQPIGVFYVIMNRSYDKLDAYEKESLETISKVTTIALDKALIYDQLVAVNKHLKDLDVAKSEFMSIASHQLRTPLAGMMGYLSMILAGDYGRVTKPQTEVLSEMLVAGQRLTRLVNSFLNATRIEAGRLSINYTKIPFDELIHSVVMELMPTAQKKQVTLTYKRSKLPTVEVDSDKIKDVVLNLVDNAIKYSPGGTITVTAKQVDNGMVRFTSTDTGVGIPAGEDKSLFEKFVRGSGIARVEPNGSGLGLFIAKKIIEAHGGKIWAESEGEGKGSTFQFEVPMKKTIASETPRRQLSTLAPTTTDTPTRIRKKDRPVKSVQKAAAKTTKKIAKKSKR